MDAAIDDMTPLGFDERLVKKTVNKLLKDLFWFPRNGKDDLKDLVLSNVIYTE
ncbi:hypothetical protein RND71_031877 [Anisodus tanguticus]|uniref:WIYLD domain-containing protein n=1 Tax=Anisodus tanguticus TaxID=243964 RepID=A0AAE1RE43_9SOLA|nr:hypothetical protein RND71_031877 [Anisodus tanguticus]